jgi:hypothetical protein
VEGMRTMMLQGKGLVDVGTDIAVLLAYAVGMLILASVTVRRSSAA